jgi:Holliday junction resolvase RusA-like endonuclease
MELNLTVPVPTSLNKLYINEYRWSKNKYGKSSQRPTGRRILSKEGQKSKNQIQAEARVQMQDQEWDYDWTKEGYVYLDTIIYFSRRGTDDNNIYKLLCDALEKIAYENDSRVLIRTQKIMYNPNNPRVEVKITPVSYIGMFDNRQHLDKFESVCKSCSRYRKGSCSILKDSINGTERKEVDVEINNCSEYKKKKTK